MPTSSVGHLVKELRDSAVALREGGGGDAAWSVLEERLDKAADALTALSSAPVDAGVEE